MKNNKEVISTSIRIDKEIYKKIIEISKSEERSINFVINRLINKALKESCDE